MTFKGITIGYIDLLGPQTNMIDPYDRKNGFLAVQNFWETVAGGSRTHHEGFVRTLICDRATPNLIVPAKSEFLQDILGYLSQFITDSDLDRFSSSILSEYWNVYLSGMGVRFVEGIENVMETWISIIFSHIWDRRFFVSTSKAVMRTGFAAQEVIEGDIICIPLGCCHPVILRAS
jgi:hypothetical protein